MSKETNPTNQPSVEKKSTARKLLEIGTVTAAAILATNIQTLRAKAYPVLFSGSDQRGNQLKYYADFDPQTKVFTGTYLSNPDIKGKIISPIINYGDGTQDAVQQYQFNGVINSNLDYMNTQGLSTLDERFIPEDQLCTPTPEGRGFQKLKDNTGNMVPGTPVLQCAELGISNSRLVPIAKTELVFSKNEPNSLKPQYFRVKK